MMASIYYAHSCPDAPQPGDRWHPLAEHLCGVALRAMDSAAAAGPANECLRAAARWAGLLHDIGKYRRDFQAMLRGQQPRSERTRHKQAAAAHAVAAKRTDVAFAIAGHHGGLPDRDELKDMVGGPNGREVAQDIWAAAVADCAELAEPIPAWSAGSEQLLFDWCTRVTFSCLVDADWQDTGAYQRRAAGLPEEFAPPALAPDDWLARVLAYIEQRARQCRDGHIAQIRRQVLEASLAAANLPPGLFSMTVPTGGGKTLSGFAFGLAHAARFGLRRVIYVAPYLSILEQNAREIRRALGAVRVGSDADIVFEHHSLAEPLSAVAEDETTDDATRRAENWDAPVVVTTNVQFFESLFSNRPAQCRKLHNICHSVVILDECQTLPPDLVAPSCQMLTQLVQHGGCSIVLCTATQPAWNKREGLPQGLDDVREIVRPSLDLFSRLRRVTVTWPKETDRWAWQQVADCMLDERAALCIVNTRSAARDLFRRLRETGCKGLLHLSTRMCPAHRLAVLDQVRRRLAAGRPCRLVATQLIECGCDVDFPLVLRELGPLEAVIQSAGRCNREGLLNGPDGSPGGRVIVFRSPEGRLPSDRWYKLGTAKLEQDFLRMGREPDIGRPDDMRDYFERLYQSGELDQRGIQEDRQQQRFATAAGKYRLIDEDTTPVVVKTWRPRADEVESLLRALRKHPAKALFSRLAPFQVNLRTYELGQAGGSVQLDPAGVKVWLGGYDPDLGLDPDNQEATLIV